MLAGRMRSRDDSDILVLQIYLKILYAFMFKPEITAALKQ